MKVLNVTYSHCNIQFSDTTFCRDMIQFLKNLYTCSYSFESDTLHKMASILQTFE